MVNTAENYDIAVLATEKDVILDLKNFGPSVLTRTIETIIISELVRTVMETTWV